MFYYLKIFLVHTVFITRFAELTKIKPIVYIKKNACTQHFSIQIAHHITNFFRKTTHTTNSVHVFSLSIPSASLNIQNAQFVSSHIRIESLKKRSECSIDVRR